MEMNYNDQVRHLPPFFRSKILIQINQELRSLEKELHTEILPGTEIMRDVGSRHFVKDESGSSRVLVPQPSDDPADPLNWSLKWKLITIVGASMVSFFQGFGPLSLAPMFPDYIEEFHCSLADAVQFTGVCILVLGFSNFIWYVGVVCQSGGTHH